MRYHPGIISVFMMNPAWSAVDLPVEPLKMESRCMTNPACTYSGSPIYIEMKISNESTQGIACVFNMLRAQGPYTTLVDNASDRRLGIPISLPLFKKDLVFEETSPEKSWIIRTEIFPSQIRYFKQSDVDLIVELSFQIPGKDLVTDQDIKCAADATIRITGAVGYPAAADSRYVPGRRDGKYSCVRGNC